MTALRRFRALSPADRLLTIEAVLALALAAACVAIVPFRRLAQSAAWAPRGPASADARAEAIRQVRSAVMRSAPRMPFRAKCFEQGLAAVWLLRRRGVAASLHYGMTRQDGSLVAHVWVTAGDRAVVGCENRDEFRELARFPAR